MGNKVLIDIPFPEDCEHCLICSLVPEYFQNKKGLHYGFYCKVTGELVNEKGRGKNCPLHRNTQAERLTDKEERIFLAAMGREEKICKQTDDEYRDCREPYEDSLVRTCHEIIRKVKGALWN